MLPLMQIIIINMFPPNKRGGAMGLSGLAVGLAPALGPTFAGWILNKDHVILGLTISVTLGVISLFSNHHCRHCLYIKFLL